MTNDNATTVPVPPTDLLDDDGVAIESIAAERIEIDPDPTHEDPAVAEKTFADYDVQDEIVQALSRVGIVHPFPIQSMTLAVALAGHDIIGQAKTGTGKTLGFGVPLLQRVSGPGEPGFDHLDLPGAPQALVIVPTRELAVQVAGDLAVAGALRAARVLTVYGGRAYEPQIDALRSGVEVVVGTPGRLLDLAQQGHLKLGHARCVVLDEADEMLDLGFLPDVERMLSLTPAGRQTMLFSATMPGAVVALARRYMTQPTHIRATDPDDDGSHTVKSVTQFAYRAHAMDKVECLARILQARDRGLTLVFARTKRTVAKVADELADRGFASGAIHGDLGQGAREQALRAFRNGKIDVLVATDVAARGIDVDDVTHVVNYQCPEDEKIYLHRIGRTARAGNKGTAITFVDWDDLHRWAMIDRTLSLGKPAPVETYSTSEHLFADLGIPADTKGVLPRTARTRAGLTAEVVEDLGETGKSRGASARSGGSGGSGSRAPRSNRDGGRDTGGRSGGHSGGADGGRGGNREVAAEESRPPRTRNRRRTRGRQSADGDGAGVPTGTASGGAGAGADDTGSADAQPRRRRRRGGRDSAGVDQSETASD